MPHSVYEFVGLLLFY